MPRDESSTPDERRRTRQQLDLLTAEQGEDRVAWDSETPEEFGYLYDPTALLVRSNDGARVSAVLDALNGSDDFEGDVVSEPLPPDNSGRAALELVRLALPARRDGDPRRVPLALDLLDERDLNTAEERVAAPDHWVHLAGGGGTRLCPATEPSETGLQEPWPGVATDPTRGDGVRVSVVDSGWHRPLGARRRTWWLRGVRGDEEHNGALLRPYAGHGTFIAGVVRCLAPGTEVYVERFLTGGSAMLESEMVRQLREGLVRKPHLINLSAGATTRLHRPLLSFEVFWEQDLSHEENCLLVAAAGNDATSDPFWPAAFDWALGVGSLDRDGAVSSFSNTGVSADVYALGRNLVNAYPNGTYVCRETPDRHDVRVFRTGLARWSGTSFAAPLVAGLIAAELGRGGDVLSARDAVLARAVTVPDPDGAGVPALLPPYT